jgi:hypothetical protein
MTTLVRRRMLGDPLISSAFDRSTTSGNSMHRRPTTHNTDTEKSNASTVTDDRRHRGGSPRNRIRGHPSQRGTRRRDTSNRRCRPRPRRRIGRQSRGDQRRPRDGEHAGRTHGNDHDGVHGLDRTGTGRPDTRQGRPLRPLVPTHARPNSTSISTIRLERSSPARSSTTARSWEFPRSQ